MRGSIQVSGARENNLQNISLDIPKPKLTVFTGLSGSGKSSLVFGTIAAESQRLINETYAPFIQNFMPSPSRPDVVARADWVIDLGPGAGRDGGLVVFQGTPAQLAEESGSLTGDFLRRRVGHSHLAKL